MYDVDQYCRSNIESCKVGTQWTAIFAFNAAILLMTAINLLAMTLGAFWFYPRYCSNIINCFCGCFGLVGFSLTLAFRHNPIGKACSINVAPNAWRNGRFTDDSTY